MASGWRAVSLFMSPPRALFSSTTICSLASLTLTRHWLYVLTLFALHCLSPRALARHPHSVRPLRPSPTWDDARRGCEGADNAEIPPPRQLRSVALNLALRFSHHFLSILNHRHYHISIQFILNKQKSNILPVQTLTLTTYLYVNYNFSKLCQNNILFFFFFNLLFFCIVVQWYFTVLI